MANAGFENIWKSIRNNNYKLDNDISSELLCTICKRLMIKASSGPCGCIYCFECIKNYLDEGNGYCPGKLPDCQVETVIIDENVHFEQSINSRIMRLIVKCPQKSCQYKDQLKKMDDHQRTCNFRPKPCLYLNIGCTKDKVESDQMNDHLETENDDHVKLLIEYVDNLKNEIKLLKKNVLLLNEQNNQFEKSMAINNENVELLNTEIRTLINDNRLIREEMRVLKNETPEKKKLLTEELDELRNDDVTLTDQLKSENEIQKTKSDDRVCQSRERWQQTLKTDDKRMQTTHEKNREIELEISKISLQNDHIEAELNTIHQLHRTDDIRMEKLERNVCQIKTDLVKQTFGEYMWVVDKISEKSQQAKEKNTASFISDAFYSHKYGYKMCLKLYLDHSLDGTNLSVFYHLMKGDFDGILSWPFQYNVKFDVIDQQTGLTTISRTLYYENFNDNFFLNKPTTEMNNKGFGFDFLNVNDVVDDQFFIKCTVDVA